MEGSVGPASEFLPLRMRPVNWSGKCRVQIHPPMMPSFACERGLPFIRLRMNAALEQAVVAESRRASIRLTDVECSSTGTGV